MTSLRTKEVILSGSVFRHIFESDPEEESSGNLRLVWLLLANIGSSTIEHSLPSKTLSLIVGISF